MNWAKERRREKKAERERDFFPLTHKLHQFTVGIRLYLKKEKRKRKGVCGGGWEMDGAVKIKIGERESKMRNFSFVLSCIYFIFLLQE